MQYREHHLSMAKYAHTFPQRFSTGSHLATEFESSRIAQYCNISHLVNISGFLVASGQKSSGRMGGLLQARYLIAAPACRCRRRPTQPPPQSHASAPSPIGLFATAGGRALTPLRDNYTSRRLQSSTYCTELLQITECAPVASLI